MKKLLVANRGEIAIRVFRAATELGLRTVGIYSHEDRLALHRWKADESYLVGQGKGPVEAYLDIDGIVDLAQRAGVDAIHPGYGFLSENAGLARTCAEADITFVGPPVSFLEAFGDKLTSKQLATRAGIPCLPGTPEPVSLGPELAAQAETIGFPLIVKASFGGGGRGMRVVRSADALESAIADAGREAGAAFGNTAVFMERFVGRAKHVEVQVFGETDGRVVHLWERDCSIQRRHQKVVEMAPATALPEKTRTHLCDAAVALAKEAGLVSAATVEFLVDADTHEFYFLEVNPRIQVEHTVTEMVTGVDIVRSQLQVAAGEKNVLPDQSDIRVHGCALQCRVTTEDPENQFMPDTGRLVNYRSPGGFGIRLDAGTAYSGAMVSPYYDSLLVKVTTWAETLPKAIQRMDRALAEFRIRGLKTNIPFLENLIRHPTFRSGEATTDFVDNTEELFQFRPRRDRATRLLNYVGEVIVNGNPDVKGKTDGRELTVPEPPHAAGRPPPGFRDRLFEDGPKKFCARLLTDERLLLTDTTFRDAHQSLLATRVRTHDMLAIAPFVARELSGLFSLEMWGGATYDAALRFLREDPWERLASLREAIPNILFQMLLRAGNAVGYTNYPDKVVRTFVAEAASQGIDVFRIFDCFNWFPNIQPAMEAVLEAGAICEPALCYTGDILDPKRDKYPLKYYVDLAKKFEAAGAHILGIKDMAGLCKPYAAYKLVTVLREETGLPIHFHTHDTSGVQAAAILKASEAGVAIADGAIASMSGLTSQPNLNSIVEVVKRTERDTGLDADALNECADYWEQVRRLYYPFESDMRSGTARVYRHEMPGGQYTNFRVQATALGLGNRWTEVTNAYEAVNQLLGDIVKVTPSSKVVGDLALFLVANGLRTEDLLDENRDIAFPQSIVDYMKGWLGQPHVGFPEKLQKIVLKDDTPLTERPSDVLPEPDLTQIKNDLAQQIEREPSHTDLINALMYPEVVGDFYKHRTLYGDTSVLPTDVFFCGMTIGREFSVDIEPGKTLIVKLLAVGQPDSDGIRTVFYELNGQPREVRIQDHALKPEDTHVHVKADPENPGHVASPMPGKVVQVIVTEGQAVEKGDHLLNLEAMKMQTSVFAPAAGRISEILVKPGDTVKVKDLLLTIKLLPAGS